LERIWFTCFVTSPVFPAVLSSRGLAANLGGDYGVNKWDSAALVFAPLKRTTWGAATRF